MGILDFFTTLQLEYQGVVKYFFHIRPDTSGASQNYVQNKGNQNSFHCPAVNWFICAWLMPNLYCIPRKLCIVQGVVFSFLSNELIVTAGLYDVALIHNYDAVRIPDGG